MKKKIGILTFNRAMNYGAVLQALALKEKLSQYDDTEIINYRCELVEEKCKLRQGDLVWDTLRILLWGNRNRKFRKFIKEISSERVYGPQDVKEFPYEKIVVGSDQVWNYNRTGEDDAFVLAGSDVKKYAYAASFGEGEIKEKQREVYKRELPNFRYIYVREQSGETICKEEFGVEAMTVLDPTLLLGKEDWKKYCAKPPKRKGYVLMYTLWNSEEMKGIAKKVSKQLGLPIYNITTLARDFFGDKVIRDADPKEWLSLFYNASFVITNSFHGTAFSINFNKPFYTFVDEELSVRFKHLSKLFHLESRFKYKGDVEVDAFDSIDYGSVNALLEEEKNRSVALLEKIVKD